MSASENTRGKPGLPWEAARKRHYSQMLGNKFRPGPEHATEQAGYDTNKRCSAGITARLPKLSETPYRGEPTLSRGRQWGRTKRGLEIV
ncbi:hypothetical protein KL930_001905 [Ogataea haglerorum]|uniref:Uncharacterized protein n=1 Tax=Ogataea haglerorum TaxID=1937702 RepID=A0ABQ7RJX9_9ASCO|nr:uncharacterized protein KL911_001846 [Ogataea haglerorum]KAG7698244.1 hypothetical protein KL915_001961 [Ogataea haglerorum]KAG7699463.1 hypothetical protein KL951_001180 [Ogataea haglerorum]KAG7708465.1 hypothetical protein KL914_002191 [Ogataea haglerorum]KAG7710507.1 hypothetical protein KL950_001420 [Ogataea haglerorum]KAG7721129.1 hypothetical protein KL913_000865 [Ogataea haglerorum]